MVRVECTVGLCLASLVACGNCHWACEGENYPAAAPAAAAVTLVGTTPQKLIALIDWFLPVLAAINGN